MGTPDRCPNCGAPAQAGAAECAGCGVVFAKWGARQARASSPAPVPAPARRGRAALWAALCLGALLLFGAARLLFRSPSAPEVPARGYVNAAFRFAFDPPEGWTLVTPGEHQAVLDEHGDRLLESFRQCLAAPVVGKTSFAAAFLKLDAAGDLAPMLGFSRNSVGLPGVGQRELELSSRALSAKLNRDWTRWETEPARIVEVAGLQAVRLAYSGTLNNPLRSAPGQSKELQVRVVELMVPTPRETYFISLTADKSAGTSYDNVLENALGSFTVLPEP